MIRDYNEKIKYIKRQTNLYTRISGNSAIINGSYDPTKSVCTRSNARASINHNIKV